MPQNNTSAGGWTVSASDRETAASAMALNEARIRVMREILESGRGPQIRPTPDFEPMIFQRRPGSPGEIVQDEDDDLTTDELEELIMADMARPKAHDEEAIRKLMKKRHLIKPERDTLHNPEPDFIESSRGESCRSACTLDVSDIIIKHKLK